jgi:hypothetical protein
MNKKPWEEFIEAISNSVTYLLSFFIIIIPPLAWLNDIFSDKSGLLWIIGTIVVFIFILPVLVEFLAHGFAEIKEKIKKGEWLRPIFVPLRAFSTILAIYGILKLEYLLIHNKPLGEESGWLDIAWQFLKTF